MNTRDENPSRSSSSKAFSVRPRRLLPQTRAGQTYLKALRRQVPAVFEILGLLQGRPRAPVVGLRRDSLTVSGLERPDCLRCPDALLRQEIVDRLDGDEARLVGIIRDRKGSFLGIREPAQPHFSLLRSDAHNDPSQLLRTRNPLTHTIDHFEHRQQGPWQLARRKEELRRPHVGEPCIDHEIRHFLP